MSCDLYGNPLGNQDYFNLTSACYASERKLYQHAITESISMFGVKVDYYLVSYSTKNQPLFGEDNNRHLQRKFPMMIQFELPPEDRNAVAAGIMTGDIITGYFSIDSFLQGSSYALNDLRPNTTSLELEPERGDLLKPYYNDTWYEIIDVIKTEDQFLQRPSHWTVTCRVYIDNHIGISDDQTITMPETSEIKDQSNQLKQNDFINSTKEEFVNLPTENRKSSPFGNF